MAQNLRAKIPDGDTLIVHDQNSEVVDKFKKEVGIAAAGTGTGEKGSGIEVADSPREIAEKSVCTNFFASEHSSRKPMMSMFHTNDLSWGALKAPYRDSTLTSKPIL